MGGLQSFSITPDTMLSAPLDTVASDGDSPAFAVALSTGSVAVMNYNTGNGRIIPTSAHGTQFNASAPVITFPPPVGGVSHPHMALELGDEVLVPDLVRVPFASEDVVADALVCLFRAGTPSGA